MAALTITALGAPVAAGSHKTKLAIVNGKEIKSGLRYGKKVFKTTNTSSAKLKFHARNASKCKGKPLGKKMVSLDDATVVITRRKPKKILVFDNSLVGNGGPALHETIYAGAVRNAADVGAVGFVVGVDAVDAVDPKPWIPAVDEDWVKGDGFKWVDFASSPADVVSLWVTKPHSELPTWALIFGTSQAAIDTSGSSSGPTTATPGSSTSSAPSRSSR